MLENPRYPPTLCISDAQGAGSQHDPYEQDIPGLFIFLKNVQEYLQNFVKARRIRGYLLTHNRKFAEFLDKLKSNPQFNGMGIEAYSIEPVQLIPRYRLLLQALLKYTPKDDRNLEITVQALQQVSEVALANNEAIRARENENKLIEIMMSFETISRVNLMDDNNRIFLKEGNLQNNAGGCRYCVCMSSLTH